MMSTGRPNRLRVAWVVPNSETWIAGLNYFRNLAHALRLVENCGIEPVIVGGVAGLPWPLDECATMHFAGLRRWSPAWIRHQTGKFVLKHGGDLEAQLRRNRIDLMSHGGWLGRRSRIPAMCWIPDFQHRHLPQFFDEHEMAHRIRTHAEIAEHAQALVVSSRAAREDFRRFHPGSRVPVHTLPFVAPAREDDALPPAAEVLSTYEINEPFLHVPNQLWAHKNHGVVVEAMRLLAERGRAPLVICTGQTIDYRNPAYFPELEARVREAGLAERLRFLGLVPYNRAAVLMRASVAMINPSMFEGWSTTVEEAKSLGKQILLSDIAVHREQAPDRGTFFPCSDSDLLADLMQAVLTEYSSEAERGAEEMAAAALPGRMRAFGETYERIVRRVISDQP